jgi:AraC-like DNA-binding protein
MFHSAFCHLHPERFPLQQGHHLNGIGMNTKLKYPTNWPELATEAKWSASALAARCEVSMSTLERYCKSHLGKSPKKWLTENRQTLAMELLSSGKSVKEVAGCLAYSQAGQFSRDFKKYWGTAPTKPVSSASNGQREVTNFAS